MSKLADYTVKRLHLADSMKGDLFTVSLAGEVLATIDYDQARRFMLGELPVHQLQDAAAVPG